MSFELDDKNFFSHVTILRGNIVSIPNFYSCRFSNFSLMGASGLLISNETESRFSPHHVNRKLRHICEKKYIKKPCMIASYLYKFLSVSFNLLIF